MKLIFALGNPGSEYIGTRHNTGFMVVDSIASEANVSFSEKTKFRAYIAEISLEGNRVFLVKPTTFYNNVGESARALIDFYKLSPIDDLLVVHDDLALPFGTIRIRKKGSDAGNNGIKSLNAHTGEEYPRIRIGIASEPRVEDDASFVLNRFTASEIGTLKEKIIPSAHDHVRSFITGDIEHTSHHL